MSDAAGRKIWIVIAAYNEAARVGATVAEVHSYCDNIAIVDDGSTDETSEAARRTGAWVLRHPINRGQGAALGTGIQFALAQGADAIVTFDADGQHGPRDIPAMLRPILSGEADVALGSRFLGKTIGIPWTRRIILKLGVLFTLVVSHIRVTDTHNGFRAFSRLAAERIRIRQDRMAHASEILDEIRSLGLRYTEVPVTIRYSAATLAKGQSSWNAARIAFRFLVGRLVG